MQFYKLRQRNMNFQKTRQSYTRVSTQKKKFSENTNQQNEPVFTRGSTRNSLKFLKSVTFTGFGLSRHSILLVAAIFSWQIFFFFWGGGVGHWLPLLDGQYNKPMPDVIHETPFATGYKDSLAMYEMKFTLHGHEYFQVCQQDRTDSTSTWA